MARKPPLATPDADIDVSIIVATKDRCDDLRDMLAHMGRAHVPADWRVELIVADNGSTDDTRTIATTAELPNLAVRYVNEPRRGKAHALTAGIEASTGRALLMTDDDVHVPPNWIEDMCRPILSGEADAVQGGITIAAHLERPWLTGVLRYWVAAVEDPVDPPEGLVGANMACSRAAFQAVGPLDTRLGPGAAGFYEDTVLGWRMEKAGYRKLFLPAVAVEHHFQEDRLTVQAFMASARRMATARAIVDQDTEAPKPAPSILSLLPQLPGLAVRGLTQLARLAIDGRPDAGFMSRYYHFTLWRKRREAATAGALAGGNVRPAR
jgi:glycosyltransferase involved in cell wall biosynthesis